MTSKQSAASNDAAQSASPPQRRGAAVQQRGNAAAQDDLATDRVEIPAVDGDISENRDRLLWAQFRIGELFGDGREALGTGLAAQAEEVLSQSVDHTIAVAFGESAAMAMSLVLGPAGKAAGPVLGHIVGRLKSDWSKRARTALEASGPRGVLFDVEGFLADYAECWKQAMYEEMDKALASGDDEHIAQVTAAVLHMAYHPEDSRTAFKVGMLLPLLRAADTSGAGKRRTDGRFTGMYNLKVVYASAPDGTPNRLTDVGLPTAVPDQERRTLLDLSGLFYEVPCQLVSDDGCVIADISVHGPATPKHVDPSATRSLQALGSDLGGRALDELRYKSNSDPNPTVRANARRTLDGYVNEACEHIWETLMQSVGSRTLRDLEQDGVSLLGRP